MNEAAIWGFLKSQGMTDAGVAGLMGNLFAESGLNPKNLQNSYEKKLGFTDATYTVAVDNGTYTNFVRDSAGYGLCQWTYWSRKQALYAFCKAIGASIGDLDAPQVSHERAYRELQERPGGAYDYDIRAGGV